MPTFSKISEVKLYLMGRITKEPGGCWISHGSLTRGGYGSIRINGKSRRVARIAYKIWIGPIPKNHDVHHTCGCRRCINPAHLETLFHGVHMRNHAILGAWAGEKNSHAKLCPRDVQFIRVVADCFPSITPRVLARQFGVTPRNVYYVRDGHSWPHVTLPEFPPSTLAEGIKKVQAAIKQSLKSFLTSGLIARKAKSRNLFFWPKLLTHPGFVLSTYGRRTFYKNKFCAF